MVVDGDEDEDEGGGAGLALRVDPLRYFIPVDILKPKLYYLIQVAGYEYERS